MGRTAVGVILWLIAPPPLRLGHSEDQFEPAGRAQDHTHQQMTASGHSPDFRGTLRGVLAGIFDLPTPERDSDKFRFASTQGESGRPAGDYPRASPHKEVHAGDTTRDPCRAQCQQEWMTTGTCRRAPHSSGEDIHQPRADVRPTTFYNDGVHPGWPGWFLAYRRPRVAPVPTARTGRYQPLQRSAPRKARVATAPRKPRVAPS